MQQEPAAWQGRRERPSPGWVNSRRGKATGKRLERGKGEERGGETEETRGKGRAEETESAEEEIKHGTKKGWTLGLVRPFPSFHMAANLWCAPVWHWMPTISGGTRTRGACLAHAGRRSLRTATKGWRRAEGRETIPLFFFFFFFSRFVSLEKSFS